MKIILLKNVPKLGSKYDIKEVADGYAHNFIIRNKIGERASEKIIAWATKQKSRIQEERDVRESLILNNLKNLDGISISIQSKANEKGHLFAGLHSSEIIAAVKSASRLDIDENHLMINKPIKTLGEHEITFKIQDKEGKFKIIVENKA